MNEDARALDERIIELQRAEFVIRSVRNSAVATKEYLDTHGQPVDSAPDRAQAWSAAIAGLEGAVRELESAFDALGIARVIVDPEVHQRPVDESIRQAREEGA